ncbi:phosphatidylglycerophosphatase and protein-tyrosine phosphatase 1 isoform X2 [Mobula hypostoma]|uniref:phosphatidylglycerophosphatase and protein-tyrosine phosphatase 1 isoform X2 n=1 Tax=Mobula hypostoma TaxID=723540 RepID=UPI002FC2A06D
MELGRGGNPVTEKRKSADAGNPSNAHKMLEELSRPGSIYGKEEGEGRLVTKENVRGVITMNEDYETKFFVNTAEEWESLGVEQLRLSTVDILGVPKLEDLKKGVDFVTKYRKKGSCVYVHCKAGRSRSATMVAAYLIHLHHWSPKKACDYIASIRSHIVVRSGQFKILKNYYCELFSEEPDVLCETKSAAAFKS